MGTKARVALYRNYTIVFFERNFTKIIICRLKTYLYGAKLFVLSYQFVIAEYYIIS